ncbi:hypothetical protein [Agromyces cerinus]|uniref:Uncharacterized protein n=1 Tax=Agromyces cerinus subsp. cerinus TaxID=232089 RepID=A0A1N6I3E8_9MICO|nr:hypothetical protein [Agromyces cerinus]SIO26511.1 hypothetical protein SAMN05443544_3630 [Agromyces cerinus subsp. cerinus]
MTLESAQSATLDPLGQVPAAIGAPAPRRSRAAVAWTVLGVALFLLLSAAVLAASAIANLRFDAAVAAHRDAVAEAETVGASTAAVEAEAASTAEIAASVLAAPDPLVDAAANAALTTVTAEFDALMASAPETEFAEPTRPLSRPIWFADLDRASDLLAAETERLTAQAAEADAYAADLAVADDAVTDSGVAYLDAIAPVAAAVEAANGSARNVERIEYRNSVEQLAGSTWGYDAAARIDAYVAAAAALQSTHAAEEAEKAGPLYDRRVEVEAYARSIAGGVLLEFDWAPIVIGYGENGSAGGTATWDTWEGGLSTITLSNSIAEQWGDPVMAALVTHEVGHAITSKCYDIVGEYANDNEPWAVAWAIGMGHTDANGNGEWLYGRPSDELIERSKACR